MTNQRNWAGNYAYAAANVLVPDTLEQVQEAVAGSDRIKGLGTRHSFSSIADSTGTHLSLAKLNRVLEWDKVSGRVTVEGGIRYGELCAYLHDNGYALPNLASLPHISVAGACATATHGSGDRNGNLATAVHALEIVRADGQAVALSRERPDDDIAGAIVGLGGLGIVTKLTLNVVPAFQVDQHVYEHLPLIRLEESLDELFSRAYSVSLFTDWKQSAFNQVWVKRRRAEEQDPAHAEAELYGARLATAKLHPVPGFSPDNCSEQMGVPGPWHERLPHFRMEFTPSAGEELQSEYFVPRRHAYAALCAIDELKESIAPLLYVSEVRSIAQDDLWMSPCYREDSIAIHFTWRPEWESVRQVLPLIENRLEPFRARPHWGKLFTMPAARLQPLYAKLADFRQLLHQYDPQGKFRNDFLRRYVLE